MPPKSVPTLRQKRLGAELRKMREHAGLSIQEASELLGADRPRITNMELARFGVSEERLRTLAALYGCADTEFINALAAMTGRRKPGWWESYRGILPSALLDLAELEHYALAMRCFLTTHMPGLLQTAAHARAVFEHGMPLLPPSQIEARVAHRSRRQAILDGDAAPPYRVVVHEAALHMQFGGTAVAHKQLRHLLDQSERPNVSLRVIPFAAGGFPGAGNSVFHASGAVPGLDTVQVDTVHTSEFLDAQTHLANYRDLLDRVETLALEVGKSRDLVHRIAQQL